MGKLILPPIHPKNVDSGIANAIELTLSNIHWTTYTELTSTLFLSDLPLSSLSNSFNGSDSSSLIPKNRMKSLWISFYGVVFVGVWVSRIFCRNKQNFINILERLLHK